MWAGQGFYCRTSTQCTALCAYMASACAWYVCEVRRPPMHLHPSAFVQSNGSDRSVMCVWCVRVLACRTATRCSMGLVPAGSAVLMQGMHVLNQMALTVWGSNTLSCQ